jgi:hypothetical protein
MEQRFKWELPFKRRKSQFGRPLILLAGNACGFVGARSAQLCMPERQDLASTMPSIRAQTPEAQS